VIPGVNRLRWQLTISHLIAIAFTLMAMIAAVLLIGSAWFARADSPSLAPAQDARGVAAAIGGLLARGATSDEISGVLASIQRGDIHLPAAGGMAPEEMRGRYASGANFIYLVMVDRDGQVLGSSDPAGAAFAPAERADWTPPLESALGGISDLGRLVAVRTGSGPAALGAYPVLDSNGRTLGAVLVAESLPPPAGNWWDLGHVLLVFGAASLAVLAAASLFALGSSSLVSYMLSRGLVRRLERLGRAAEDLAAGDLSRRAEDAGAADEVGQLARRFNFMADRLSQTLAELAAEKAAVESALEAKRELVANVSHELRTPLASIRAHTESVLMREDVDPALHTYLEVIDRQSEQLSRLIDDLFLLSTTESGALTLAPRPIVLDEVIDEVVRSIRPVARVERHISLLSEVEAGLPPVLADRQRVAQVLANLLRNAVRHTPEGGLVAVRAARRNGVEAAVSVEDTGQGIAPEQLDQVFERFYRAEPSRDRASGGAGLGLAIVRELVHAMGGRVWAESVVGQGSRFSFTLPLVV
jgi:signal transduction histidine kinase